MRIPGGLWQVARVVLSWCRVPMPLANAQPGQVWSVLGGGDIYLASAGVQLNLKDLLKAGILPSTGLIVNCGSVGCSEVVGEDGRLAKVPPGPRPGTPTQSARWPASWRPHRIKLINSRGGTAGSRPGGRLASNGSAG